MDLGLAPRPPVPAVEIDEKLVADLHSAGLDRQFRVLRNTTKENAKFLKDVREKVKGVKNFWLTTLINSGLFNFRLSSASDRDALSYLSDIELIQDEEDPRAFELVFHFDENPYFTNKSLSKKYNLPEGAEAAPKDGSITDEMRDFEVDQLVPSTTTIDWKPEQDLIAKYPRTVSTDADAEDDDFDGDIGSFFYFFTTASEPDFDVGVTIAHDILADPIEHFLNEDEDDDDEDDEDDEGSIDLDAESEEEGPARKKQK